MHLKMNWRKKKDNIWLIIIMISHRLIDFLLGLNGNVIQNVSWKAKQRSRKITVLPDLPFFHFQNLLLQWCRGFWCPLFVIKINGVKNTFSYPSLPLSQLLSSTYIFSFIYSFVYFVSSSLLQKLLLRIFEKRNKMEFQLIFMLILVPGRLLSLHRNWRRMAVYQSWVKSVLLGILMHGIVV